MKETLKTILCFGDSNTHGYNPNDGTRWPYSVRWTGILQKELGNDFHVIEEGLGGRTSVFDDPLEPGRKGIRDIPMLIETHKPLDLVIIMLGTNDTKNWFSASPVAIAAGCGKVIEAFQDFRYGESKKPEILLVSPIHIGPETEKSGCAGFDISSHEKTLQLAPLYKAEAEKHGVSFFDAATVAEPGIDNVHLDIEGHKKFAIALSKAIKTILNQID